MTIFDALWMSQYFYKDECGNVYISPQVYGVTELGCFQRLDSDTCFLPKEIYDEYSSYRITIAEDKSFEKLNYIRRPYYRMRGKPVTKEQAFDIIRRTDNLFSFAIDDIARHEDFVGCQNFDNWLIMKNHYPKGYGWIHADGTVGANAITQKYPDMEEFLQEWFLKLQAFPYLDLIIAMTEWNELPDSPEDKFEDAVLFGIHVHDREIAILSKQDALAVYQEYDEKFGSPAEKFESEYYEDHGIEQVSEADLRRCIESYGLDAAQELGKVPEYIWKKTEKKRWELL